MKSLTIVLLSLEVNGWPNIHSWSCLCENTRFVFRAQSSIGPNWLKPVPFWPQPKMIYNMAISQHSSFSSTAWDLHWKHGRWCLDRRWRGWYMVAKLGLKSRVLLEFICPSVFPGRWCHRYRAIYNSSPQRKFESSTMICYLFKLH